ncbi:MAG: acyl-CoA/acyl-ACP dehydrogenase [Methylobacteriaceae bacterium]|nr:acyl-CoA/acyl-ACP dehydrogenase [Methylobacteriaceae bacterium]
MTYVANSLIERAAHVAAVAARHADSVDREGRFPHEARRALADARLFGAMIPKEHGGEGAALSDIAEICCQLAQACASTGMIYAMHQIKASSLIEHGAGAPWHEDFMRRVATEQLLLGSATTEGGIGGDLRNSICAVVTEGERFTLEKNATVISYGADADAILVTARRALEAASSDQVMVVLRKQDYTLEKTSGWDTLGMRGTCSDGYLLKSAGATAQVLPQPFAEIAAQSMLAMAHLLWSSLWFGIASSAFGKAQAFVRAEARRAPGKTPPGALRLAEAGEKLQVMRSTILDGLRRYEEAKAGGDDLGSMSFVLAMNNVKTAASQTMIEVVNLCLMICGIAGYKNDTPFSLGRELRDALSAPIMINNDRILSNSATLLLAHRVEQRLAV